MRRTAANRPAGGSSSSTMPGSGRAACGASTIGDRVPSKSRQSATSPAWSANRAACPGAGGGAQSRGGGRARGGGAGAGAGPEPHVVLGQLDVDPVASVVDAEVELL